MADLSYNWEKFSTAVYSFTSPAPVKERLESAFLSFHVLTPKDFEPWPEIRESFAALMNALTAKEATFEGEGRVRATIKQMTDDEAAQLCSSIVDICYAIARERRTNGG